MLDNNFKKNYIKKGASRNKQWNEITPFLVIFSDLILIREFYYLHFFIKK
jgi:hypothetical protein